MKKPLFVLFGKEKMTFSQLSELTGIGSKTLYLRWKVAGRPADVKGTEVLRAVRGDAEFTGRSIEYNQNDTSPGWLERREFPQTGRSGFYKN